VFESRPPFFRIKIRPFLDVKQETELDNNNLILNQLQKFETFVIFTCKSNFSNHHKNLLKDLNSLSVFVYGNITFIYDVQIPIEDVQAYFKWVAVDSYFVAGQKLFCCQLQGPKLTCFYMYKGCLGGTSNLNNQN
jgi:hypothetical protein